MRTAYRLMIHCPVSQRTLQALMRGEVQAVHADPQLAPLLNQIRTSTDLGNFGAYRGVCEIGIGLEAFTPQPGARPTVGTAGESVILPTVTLTTYIPIDTSEARLAELLDSLTALHPWELPVAEITTVHLAETKSSPR